MDYLFVLFDSRQLEIEMCVVTLLRKGRLSGSSFALVLSLTWIDRDGDGDELLRRLAHMVVMVFY